MSLMYISVCVFPADVQQLLVIKEEVPWSSSLDQQDPEPVHIKEEEEELWSRQEGEQLHGQEETDLSRFSVTAVTVKSEDDEEQQPQSSQLHQIKTEDNRETETPTSSSAELMKTEADWGKEPYPNSRLQPDTDEQEFCETEVSIGDDDGDWPDSESEASDKEQKRTVVPESGLNHDGGCYTAKKSFSCSECNKQFLSKQSLKSHMRVHIGGQPFGGGPETARNPDQNSHLQPNTDSDSSDTEVSDDDNNHWQDPLSDSGPEYEDGDHDWRETRTAECGENYDDLIYNSADKSFSCSECGKQFSHEQSLKSHMSVHTREQPFACVDCGKRFSKKAYLRSHKKVHTGEKPFGCDVCGKRFSRNEHLKTHMRVHTGEKPFGCDDCGKRFSRNTLLKTHMRVHTGEKPFSCDFCGKRFNQVSNLKTHMRVHTMEKPYTCDDCGKKFKTKTHLKSHMRVHTMEKPYDCDDCGRKFKTKTHLKTHMKVHEEKKNLSVMIVKDYFAKTPILKLHFVENDV